MRKAALAVVIWSTAGMLGFGAPIAQAMVHAPNAPTCNILAVETFSPGVTQNLAPQDVSLDAQFNPQLTDCSGGAVTDGFMSLNMPGTNKGNSLSCTAGSETTRKVNGSVKWNTGKVSRIIFTVSATGLSGVIKRGKFAGDKVVANVTVTPMSRDCFKTPMTKASIKGTISF